MLIAANRTATRLSQAAHALYYFAYRCRHALPKCISVLHSTGVQQQRLSLFQQFSRQYPAAYKFDALFRHSSMRETDVGFGFASRAPYTNRWRLHNTISHAYEMEISDEAYQDIVSTNTSTSRSSSCRRNWPSIS